jgi:hypothetical protein
VFCTVTAVRVRVLCCDSSTLDKSFKNVALVCLLFSVHPQVTTNYETVCVTWFCIANVTKQNTSHDADSRSSAEEINSLLWNHFVHKNSPLVPILRELLVVHIYTYYFFEIHINVTL